VDYILAQNPELLKNGQEAEVIKMKIKEQLIEDAVMEQQ
jgi:hypothetical protein